MTPKGDEIETVDGIAVRSGKQEFDAAELRACGRCGRSNAPNRGECIYCGAALGGGEPRVDLVLREAELWERAFNLVLLGGTGAGELPPFPIADEILQQASELAPPLPVARVATAEMGESVRTRLEDTGSRAMVISDDDLAPERPPTRLRSLTVDDSGFSVTTFNTGEQHVFRADSLELIVVGRLFEERAEQTVKRNQKDTKEMDARSLSKDSGVLDVYFAGERNGFRILESGFDFSCLRDDKGLLASANMPKLVIMLTSTSPGAAVSSDYVSKRKLLDKVWPSQARHESKGVQRSGLSVSLTKAEVTSNTDQFTRYSRLVRRTL